jgi:hypothetical protein
MAMRVVEWTSESLLKAQGRFPRFMVLTGVHALVFVPCVWFAARFGDISTVAWAVSGLIVLLGPVRMYVAVRPLGGGWRALGKVLLVPVAGSLAGWGVARVITRAWTTQSRMEASAIVVTATAAFACVYGVIAFRACPPELANLWPLRWLATRREVQLEGWRGRK